MLNQKLLKNWWSDWNEKLHAYQNKYFNGIALSKIVQWCSVFVVTIRNRHKGSDHYNDAC